MAKTCTLLAFGVIVLLSIGGCQTGRYPDPNDPAEAGIVTAEVVLRDLRGTSKMLWDRVGRREITDAQAHELLRKRANELIQVIESEQVDPNGLYEYAELYRVARRWEEAKKLLEGAVETAPNNDRKVNDSLRLAMVLANLGKVKEGIARARTVFDVPPADKAPILPSLLYEFEPAARNKGQDVEVAALLEDAIKQHRAVVVDETTEPGQAFLAARFAHIRKAWEAIDALLREAKRPDLVEAARKRRAISMRDASSL